MTRSVLNAQSVVRWQSIKTESQAQYWLFVMVSFIISHCKRNFPLDPCLCLHSFFLIQAPCADQRPVPAVQVLLFGHVPRHSAPLQLLQRVALIFSEALVGAQPHHAVGNIWSCGGKTTTTHTHNRKPCCVATTEACLLYPDEMKLSQLCLKKKKKEKKSCCIYRQSSSLSHTGRVNGNMAPVIAWPLGR